MEAIFNGLKISWSPIFMGILPFFYMKLMDLNLSNSNQFGPIYF